MAHSRYYFVVVYADDMPETLPAALFIRQLLRKASGIIRITMRAIVEVFVWLIMLPYITLWVWRFYFWIGDNLALSMHGDNSTTANTTLVNEQNTELNSSLTEDTISSSLFSAR
jgi:E3 ubiquitin-protein ligase DOA10